MEFTPLIPIATGYYWFITPYSEPNICEIRGGRVYLIGDEEEYRTLAEKDKWKFSPRLTPPTPY